MSAARPPSSLPATLQTTTDADRHQQAKQYWPIRRASNKILYIRLCGKDVSDFSRYSRIVFMFLLFFMLVYFVIDACLVCCVCFSFSVLCQVIGWGKHLQNDLFCVGWDLKPGLNLFSNAIIVQLCRQQLTRFQLT